MKNVIIVVVLCTSVCASAGIIVDFPDTKLPVGTTTASITVTAMFEQYPAIYDIGGFNLKLDITGDAGCIFTGVSSGAPSYALGVGNNWDPGSIINAGRTIENVTDARDNDAHIVDASGGDVVLNLVVLDFAFSGGISSVDQFIINFDAASTNDTAFFKYSGDYHEPVWNGGTITPEPTSMALLALGSLLALRRKRQ